MYSQLTAIIIALAAAPIMVSAHGKISLVTGDLGGNGTGLGIQGAVVPGMGPNYKTEVDTTVFWSKDISTDNDIGFTESGSGNNQLTDITDAMAQSGSTLPQVSSSGGSINTTWHVVTDDGCGPVEALIDESASGKWSTAKSAAVTTDMPGSAGDCPSDLANDSGNENKVRRALRRGLEKMGLISKRAANVDKDFVSIFFLFIYISLIFLNLWLTSLLFKGSVRRHPRWYQLQRHRQRHQQPVPGQAVQQQRQRSLWWCRLHPDVGLQQQGACSALWYPRRGVELEKAAIGKTLWLSSP